MKEKLQQGLADDLQDFFFFGWGSSAVLPSPHISCKLLRAPNHDLSNLSRQHSSNTAARETDAILQIRTCWAQ